MATAAGKITAARIATGDHVMVSVESTGTAVPSRNKVKGASRARVISVTVVPRGRQFVVETNLGHTYTVKVAAHETFWLARDTNR